MKLLRKWSRILHRDIGFFFIGTSIVFGLSGIALNHLNDWNPNYTVETEQFTTDIDLSKSANTQANVIKLVEEYDNKNNLRKYYYPRRNLIKIFLKGGSNIIVNTDTGKGRAEFLSKRAIFYQVNYLHYNPNNWWMWFSDIFAGSLILFAVTGIFMVRGPKGITGRGAIYTIAGVIIPIVFLLLS